MAGSSLAMVKPFSCQKALSRGQSSAGWRPETESQRWLPSAFHFDAFDAGEDFLAGGLSGGGAAGDVAGADCAAACGELVEVSLVGVGEVGGDFEVDDFAVFRLVVELGLFFFAAGAGGQAEGCGGDEGGFDGVHADSVWIKSGRFG